MPLVRTLKAFQWLASCDRGVLLLFLIIWPMYLIGACFWSFGFLQEADREMLFEKRSQEAR
jgi:hypothetical protein